MTEILDPIAIRRDLHDMPELAMKEVRTAAYLADKLEALGYDVERQVGGTTGVIGTLKGAEEGPTLMIRADMDALPFTIDGKPCAIHACGHDAHSAMVLAAASALVPLIKRGTLKVLFQPAEESIEGALAMVKAGAIDDVDMIVGAHIRPVQDLEPGTLCAAVNHVGSTNVMVTIKGHSAHAARPHLGVNVIDVGAAVVQAVQAIWLNPAATWTAKATQFHADKGATNSIPDEAHITFDVRAGTNELMKELLEKMERAVTYTAQATGAEAIFERGLFCPAADYDEALTAEIADCIKTVAGADKLAKPCGGGGEDFHHYRLSRPELPAAYFGVGVGATPGLHAANMSFDEQYLPLGTQVFVEWVKRHLG